MYQQYYISCRIAGKCGGFGSFAWLLAFTKSFAPLDGRIVGLFPIKQTNYATDNRRKRLPSLNSKERRGSLLFFFFVFNVRLLLIGGALSIKSERENRKRDAELTEFLLEVKRSFGD